jgi:head-tail adaptor
MKDNLDRRITVLRKTETASSSGERVTVWSPLSLRRSASMRPVRGEERFENPTTVATDQTEFHIRYSSDVADLTPLDRIIQPALVVDEDPAEVLPRFVHDIISVQEIGRRDGLKIITLRRPDIKIVDVADATPTDGPSLDFSNPDNSMYINII